MTKKSKSELYKQIQSEYHKKLKDLESKLAIKRKEMNKIEQSIKNELRKVSRSDDRSNLSALKAKRGQLNISISKLEKQIKHLNKERVRKIKKIQRS
jgi:uncharacterized protein involved in exopolysaccharide biosynthesis